MEIVSMTCRNCGGKIRINNNADQFICQNCGSEFLISINEGAISIKLLSEGLIKISKSTDKTASELALERLKDEKVDLITSFYNISSFLKSQEANDLITQEYYLLKNGNPFDPN